MTAAMAMVSPTRYLVLDLETVPAPDLPYLGDPGPLDGPQRIQAPIHHQIVAATGIVLRADYRVDDMRTFTDEREAIERNVVAMRDLITVTWNGRAFDLPVLAARAFARGIPFPNYYNSLGNADMRSRYKHGGHLDLCDYLSDYGAARQSRLEAYARACGFPGKIDGVDGSSVAAMVAEGRLDDVARYNAEDAAQTTAVFLRAQMVIGRIEVDDYIDAMVAFINWIEDQPVLSRLAQVVDRERAMDVGQ